MRTAPFTGLVLLAACLAPGCDTAELSLDVNGATRSYRLHVPPGLDPATPVPLLIALHQFTDTGQGMQALTGFDALADAEGFLVAYPNGKRRVWNTNGPGDVDFIMTLVDTLSAQFAIAPDRVYLAGISAGGAMAQYLACQTDRFAGMAIVAASLERGTLDTCADAGAIPFLGIHGTADPVIPYEGGETFAGPGNTVDFPSAEETLAFWAARNGCDDPGDTAPIVYMDDTGFPIETIAANCSGAPAVHYRVVNGGHTWPGGNNRYPEFITGPAAPDFDAATLIWEFLQQHTRGTHPTE